MGLTEAILGNLLGKVQFIVAVDGRPAVEVKIEGKTIIVDVVNPVLAARVGVEEFIKRKPSGRGVESDWLKRIKKMGYKIKIKYKMLEFEL